MEVSKTFCVLPWIHRFTNVGGEVQICCTAEEHDPTIFDDAGKPMHISSIKNDEEVMNSQFLKNFRLKMLEGEWSTQCERCRVTECSGGVSRRQNENSQYGDLIPRLLTATEPDGTIPMLVISSDFRIGNVCNLACRMCNPRSSTRWITELEKADVGHVRFSQEALDEFKGYDWYRSEKIVEQLRQQLPTLRHLHFAGGEPLILPEMIKLLQVCVDSGYSKNIELTYNTNISKVPSQIKSLWPKFGGVRLFCSIDGFDEVNTFIRHPAKWRDIDANLRDIDRNHENYGIKEVIVMCTLQAYNVLRLPDLFDYLANNFNFVTQIPHLVDLHYPTYYRTQILPQNLKMKARISMENLVHKTRQRIAEGLIPRNQEKYLETLIGAISFLDLEDLEKWIPYFVSRTFALDRSRAQRTFVTLPELSPMVESLLPAIDNKLSVVSLMPPGEE